MDDVSWYLQMRTCKDEMRYEAQRNDKNTRGIEVDVRMVPYISKRETLLEILTMVRTMDYVQQWPENCLNELIICVMG